MNRHSHAAAPAARFLSRHSSPLKSAEAVRILHVSAPARVAAPPRALRSAVVIAIVLLGVAAAVSLRNWPLPIVVLPVMLLAVGTGVARSRDWPARTSWSAASTDSAALPAEEETPGGLERRIAEVWRGRPARRGDYRERMAALQQVLTATPEADGPDHYVVCLGAAPPAAVRAPARETAFALRSANRFWIPFLPLLLLPAPLITQALGLAGTFAQTTSYWITYGSVLLLLTGILGLVCEFAPLPARLKIASGRLELTRQIGPDISVQRFLLHGTTIVAVLGPPFGPRSFIFRRGREQFEIRTARLRDRQAIEAALWGIVLHESENAAARQPAATL